MSYQIKLLLVNEMREPLGLDVANPLFSWRFTSKHTMEQACAQILVGSAPGKCDFWDSGIMATDRSIGIRYEGHPLQPESRYYVTLYTWDKENIVQEKQTFFETGMLNPKLEAWEGAEWIGAPGYYVASDTLSVFTIASTIRIRKGTRGGIVFGANDPRLLDREKNEMLIAGENYIRYVLNIAVSPAQIEIYRMGYALEDTADSPFAVFPVVSVSDGTAVITKENCRKPHKLSVEVVGNAAYTYVDGICVDQVETPWYYGTLKNGRQLNPLGTGDVTTFPRLCSIGYYAGKGSCVSFDGLHVFHERKPNAEIITLDPDGKHLKGEKQEIIDPSCYAIPMLRCDFQVKQKLVQARLYATARGIYECSINGRRVGDEYFAPGASQYDKHLMYQTYDVTNYLREGVNGIGCTLASGWWCDAQTYNLRNYNFWGDRVSFLAKLVLIYADGSRQVVVTDPEYWQYYGEGPYRYAGFFNGEQYDARRGAIFEQFSTPGFRLEGMKRPEIIKPVPIETNYEDAPVPWPTVNLTEPDLVGNYQAPVHAAEIITAKSMSEPAPGIYIYDLGQEIAGVPLLKLRGKQGQKITIRYSEMLYPHLEEYGEMSGRMLQANLREASNMDVYICNGVGIEIYQPKFTFHGFRYIEISGIDYPPRLGEVQGVLLSSVAELSGSFTCSNPLVNKLVSNVGYSQRCNFISIPTDCPQRNERMGWVGDTHVFCRTAAYQSNVKNFYLRNLEAMRDLQTPEGRLPNIAPVGGGFGGITYESAMVLMVWELYQQYGDPSVIGDYYPCMKKWMTAMERAGFPGVPREFGLGDWLSPEDTDIYLIWNAFHYRNCMLMSKFAKILGQATDADYYQAQAAKTRSYWKAGFLEPDTGMTRSLDGKLCDTQGSYAIALVCGVVPQESQALLSNHLARKTRECGCTVRTGFFGTGALNPMLSEGGHRDLAQKLINQTNYPSWLYPITQGATTIWERWDSYTIEKGFNGQNSMNSFNHYSLGSVVSWLYEYVLGIRRDEDKPGFKHFFLIPETGGFTFAQGGIETPHGRIKSAWKYENATLSYQCTIPANTTATLVLNGVTKELSSGSYTFHSTQSDYNQRKKIELEGR